MQNIWNQPSRALLNDISRRPWRRQSTTTLRYLGHSRIPIVRCFRSEAPTCLGCDESR